MLVKVAWYLDRLIPYYAAVIQPEVLKSSIFRSRWSSQHGRSVNIPIPCKLIVTLCKMHSSQRRNDFSFIIVWFHIWFLRVRETTNQIYISLDNGPAIRLYLKHWWATSPGTNESRVNKYIQNLKTSSVKKCVLFAFDKHQIKYRNVYKRKVWESKQNMV